LVFFFWFPTTLKSVETKLNMSSFWEIRETGSFIVLDMEDRGIYGENLGIERAIADDGPKKPSYKDRQEERERKAAGELPPDIDEETGKIINPHNPEFITKVPWYLGESGPTLKHHAAQKVDVELSMNDADALLAKKHQQQRILKKQSSKPTTFRRGACKNCGAMTHKEKDCVERPRSKKRTAAATNTTLSHDEAVLSLEQHGKVGYAAKRDKWQGYDVGQYAEVVKKFDVIDEERRKIALKEIEERKIHRQMQKEEKARLKKEKEKKKDAEINADSDWSSESDTEGDEDLNEHGVKDEVLQRDEDATNFQSRTARQGGVGGAQMKVTVRNLRIREDVPKYLRNLDLNSAFYDAKSRSMRSNPFPDQDPSQLPFAGDNFVRMSGDAIELARQQVMCWEMEKQGGIVLDPLTNPSAAEAAHRAMMQNAEERTSIKKSALKERYGESETQELDPRLVLGSSETQLEYTRDGRVKGESHIKRYTKYEEDVYPGNHTSVWGSWYDKHTMQWGYQCCHQVMYAAYCLGKVTGGEGPMLKKARAV
jgi:pre-mRNA-processing factor SLU7